jgi:hypothetical protein
LIYKKNIYYPNHNTYLDETFYFQDEQGRKDFYLWLNELWAEKDQILDSLLSRDNLDGL